MISKLEASFIEKIIAHTVDGKITWRSYNPKKDDFISNEPLTNETLSEDFKSYASSTLYYEEKTTATKNGAPIIKKKKCTFRIDHWHKRVRLICWFISEDDFTMSSFKIESMEEKMIEYRMLYRLFLVAESTNDKKVEADKVSSITSFISNFK